MDEDGIVPSFVAPNVTGVSTTVADDGMVEDEQQPITQSPTPREIVVPSSGFVKSLKALWSTMIKMHARNDGVIFDNESGDFKMLVRCSYDVDSPEEAEFEVCIIVEDGQTTLSKILKYELDGEYDDDEEDVFVVGSVDVDDIKDLSDDSPEVKWLMKTINEIYEWRFCNCGKGFVKEEDVECMRCMLTATDADMEAVEHGEECLVCRDPCGRRWVKTMTCCGAIVHSRCFARWAENHDTCPHCRAESSDTQVVDAVITILN
jgi:hypothetical protein